METKTSQLEFKIKNDFEVIGYGELVKSPCQIGNWWIMPAQDYQGKVPPDIQKKLFEFLSQGIEVQGFLIAEDIQVIEAKREQEEKRKEASEKAVENSLGALVTVFSVIGIGLLYFLSALCAYDPMLIAVLKDGRWVCLGTWFD